MSNFNQVVRAASNGEVTVTQNGQAVGRLRVMWNDSYTNREGVRVDTPNTIELYAFGSRAQALATRVTGEQLHIQGQLKVRQNVSDKFQRIGGEPGVTFTNVSVDVTRGQVQYLTTREERERLIAKHGANPNEEAVETSDADAEEAVEAALAASIAARD